MEYKNKKINIRNLLDMIVACVLAIGVCIVGVHSIADVFGNHYKKKQLLELQEVVKELTREKEELVAKKTKLENPDYMRTYARGEYMFSKGDEIVFRLPEKEK